MHKAAIIKDVEALPVFQDGVHEGVVVFSKKLTGSDMLYRNVFVSNFMYYDIVSLEPYDIKIVVPFKFFNKPRKISGIWFDGTTNLV